jgi:hypothetical protein
VLLAATTADPGGCLTDEGEFFTSAELTAFAPLLHQLVTSGGLPEPSA